MKPTNTYFVSRQNNSFFFPEGRQINLVHLYVHGSVHRESISINVQQDATVYTLLYFCKLLYMFRVVSPPIIRSAYKCNYSIWHWSNRICYLPLSWSSSNFSTIAEGSRYGLTSARCCNYSYMYTWWWVKIPPEICRAVYRNIINCI